MSIWGNAITLGSSGGGGGPSASDAILTVTVPTGSTVTAVKGGVTLTPTMWVQAADPTLDCALFVIAPNLFDAVNAWTVTATLGHETGSETIIISSNKQYDMFIQMTLYLYDAGDENTAVTGGWEAKSRNGYLGTLTKNADNMVLNGNNSTSSAFAGIANDITNLQSNYSTAYIETGSVSANDNGFAFLDNWTTQTIISRVTLSANSIHSLPIPSGSSVIAVYAYLGSVTIKKVWME